MNKVVVAATLVLLVTIGASAYAYTVYLPSLYGPSTSGQGGASTGTLSIYLTDGPPNNASLKSLLVNVTSVTLVYSSLANATTTTTTSHSTTTNSSTSTTNSTTTTSSTITSTSTNETSSGGDNETSLRFVFQVPGSVGTNLNLTKLQGSQILLGETKAPAGNVVQIIFNITGARAFWTDGTSTQLKVVADGKLMVPVHFTIQAGGSANLTADITPNTVHISQGHASVLTPVIHVQVVSSGEHSTETTETSVTVSENSTSTSS